MTMSYFLTRIPSMSQYIPQIKRHATRLRLSSIGANITSLLQDAEQSSPSYDELIFNLFSFEVKEREAKQLLTFCPRSNIMIVVFGIAAWSLRRRSHGSSLRKRMQESYVAPPQASADQ